MWWDGKIQRTFRCRLDQSPGSLGRLLTAIGDRGGLIGEIRTIHMGGSAVDRDITVYADDLRHLDALVKTVETAEGAQLLEVRDEVLEMHQGGKIAIRSRYDISSLSTLRRVYTPGVAEVSLKIKGDPSLARRYTSIRHLVAIVTDGTAVLGLGDIGPKAAMPVMEGKASLLETLTGDRLLRCRSSQVCAERVVRLHDLGFERSTVPFVPRIVLVHRSSIGEEVARGSMRALGRPA